MIFRPSRTALPCAIAVLLAATHAAAVDWKAVADVEEITVITTNEDGTSKETTIWLAVHEGQGYIRTSDTSWWENIARDDAVVLRIEGTDHPLRAVKIPSGETFDQVTKLFRTKYGFSDVMISPFRFGEVKIMRMEER